VLIEITDPSGRPAPVARLSAARSAGLAADEHALNPGLLIGKVAIALGIAAAIGWVVGEVGVRRARPPP